MNSSTSHQNGDRNEPGRQSLGLVSSRRDPDRAADAGATESRRVLFLDDDPARAESFLSENQEAIWVQTVEECLGRLVETWDEVHLDHDLGGQVFVDMDKTDCGMEVIRWLCRERRDHLSSTQFFVHTHNSLAGLLMVLQMRSSGYRTEFRPFGIDPARFLPGGDNGPSLDEFLQPDDDPPPPPNLVGLPWATLHRWWDRLRGYWTSRTKAINSDQASTDAEPMRPAPKN